MTLKTVDPPDQVPRSRRFRLEREENWLELERMLERLSRSGPSGLSAEETERFPGLYRLALSSLSVARAIALDRALIEYLDNLAVRAYLAVYEPPEQFGKFARDYAIRTLPRAVRALRWHVGIMMAVLILASVSGYTLVHRDLGWFEALVPSDLAGGRGSLSTTAELRNVLTTGVPDIEEVLRMIADALFAHNTTIGLMMFGLGPLAGVPTIFMYFEQGLILGAFFALHAHHGLSLEFAGWVFIHGVTELGALVLFGAAGLKLGEILVFPGQFSRAECFAILGPTVGAVAAGAGGMLLIAAVLEGFFRQAIISTDVRLVVATATLVGWLWYFSLCGRQENSD
jgi:uncharacterized membrane protein SpoIIM required for sporulation